MKQLRRHFSVMVMCLALIELVTSCSDDNELLQTVPANSTAVVTINLENILKESEISIKAGKLNLPLSLRFCEAILPFDVQKSIADIYSAVDASGIVIYSTDERYKDVVMTLRVTDRAVLESYLKNFDSKNAYGFTVYNAGEVALVYDGESQLWLVEDDGDAVYDLQKNLKYAADKNIADINGVGKVLASGATFSTAYRNTRTMLADNWVTVSGNLRHSKIEARMQMFSCDGETLSLNDMNIFAPISSDVFDYAPRNTVAAVAFGVSPDFNWSNLTNLAQMAGVNNSGMGGVSGMFASGLLNSLNGSVSICIAPREGSNMTDWINSGENNWTLTAAAQVNGSRMKMLMSQLQMLCSLVGRTNSTDNGFTIRINRNITANVVLDDDILVLGINAPVMKRGNNIGDVMDGDYAGALLRLPPLNTVFADCPLDFGMRVNVGVDNDAINCSVEVTDTDKSLMQCLFEVLSSVKGNSNAPINDYFDDMDSDYIEIEECYQPDNVSDSDF